MTQIFGDDRNASHRVSTKLVCMSKGRVLLIRKKDKDVFNLVGGGVDRGEGLSESIQREFQEETGHNLGTIQPKLLHVEIRQFAIGGQFDAVVNIFYGLYFDDIFELILEDGVYEEYGRFSKDELQNLPVSDHTNKDLLLSFLV